AQPVDLQVGVVHGMLHGFEYRILNLQTICFTRICCHETIVAMQDRTHSLQAASLASAATAQAAPTAQETRGQWLMIAGGVLLGTVGIFVEEARQHPLVTVLFRCAFGALALLAWGLATGRMGELRVRGRSWPVVVATGLLMVLNWALFFAAIPLTSIGVATIVFHIQPVWIM
ncbi:EamA family transporter, partial [Acinetobacter baumannii]|nr:EamA family transporter [Acinetobacter baumannii]